MNGPRAGSTRFAIRNNSRVAYDPGSWPGRSGHDEPVIVVLHDLLADRTAFTARQASLTAGPRPISTHACFAVSAGHR